MTDIRALRPKGWTGPVWVEEVLVTGVDDGEQFWCPWNVFFHNATENTPPGRRVRRATITMEE